MKNINFKKDILPHIIAVAVFFIIVAVYYQPIFFSNHTINQNDVLQGLGGGQEAIEFREKTGDEALWTNSMFGGMPAYLINVYWSGDLVNYVQKILAAGFSSPADATFLCFISFYILLLVFKVRPYFAMLGALAFGLNSFNIISIEAGHMWKVRAMAYMPLVLAGIHLLFRDNKKLLLGFALTALALTLEIRSNHFQITYYLVLLLMIYGINVLVQTLRSKNYQPFLKSAGLLILAGILAIGCNLGRLWSTYEYGQYSTRGKSDLSQENSQPGESGLDRDYVFAWSSGKLESMTLLIPNFYGGASQQNIGEDSNLGTALKINGAAPQQIKQFTTSASTYWGDQPFTSGPIYAGAIICFLFILGLILADKRTKYWILGGVIFSLLLSWGKNFEAFNYLMYDYFPGYNKFRAVSMAVSIALLVLPLLGFIGLEKFLNEETAKKKLKALIIALGVTGGLALIAILFAGLGSFKGIIDERLSQLPPWFVEALREDRKSLLRADAFRSLFFIIGMATVLYFILKEKLSIQLGIIIAGVLIILDLWTVDKRYLNEENFGKNTKQRHFAATDADKRILAEQGNARVLNLANPWNEARTSYHHSSIGGYHGAKLKRYQELIDYCLDDQKNGIIESIQQGDRSFEQFGVLNMLNTGYLTYGPEANNVIVNPSKMGNAWVANAVKKVNNADEELAETCQLNAEKVAIVDVSKFNISNTAGGAGNISLVQYKPNYLKYDARIDKAGIVVFSEIYYPKGWVASIDGKTTEHIRANYILRALELNEGNHTIEFEFKPQAYYTGNKVMIISSVVLMLSFAFSIIMEARSKLKDE